MDLDGTLADLSSFYRHHEKSLFGTETPDEPETIPPNDLDESEPSALSHREKLKIAKEVSGRQETIWRVLRETRDLWTLLEPLEPGVVKKLYDASIVHRWEVFFITQRPASAGATVQLQTQRWLIAQGFETPSVLTVSGSRGKAAGILELDFLIDDLPKNCIDTISDSRCRPILVLRGPDPTTEIAAQRMNIGVVHSIAEAIELLAQPKSATTESTVAKILRRLGLSR